jgi:hypothetical protein
MNFIIQLHTNDNSNKSSDKISVHEELVDLLELELKTLGGFKRFEIDILDETEQVSNVIVANNWLNTNVFIGEDKKAVYKALWNLLGDKPTDEDGNLWEWFLDFEIGTDREEIWHWFEETFNISVAEDLMNLK